MADITIKCGTGVRYLWYAVKYPGESLEEGVTGGAKAFYNASYVKLYCDAGDLKDGYGEPLSVSYHYRGSTYEYTDSWHSGYNISSSKVVTVSATLAAYNITYNWDNGIDGPINGKKYKGSTYYLSSKKPKRSGYVFRYWSDNLGSGKPWRPGDAYTTDAAVTFKAVWAQKTYFYWHGSDDNDNNYFQVDKRVDLAVTASNWAALCQYVNLLHDYCWITTKTFDSVSAGDEISASGFNTVADAIQECIDAVTHSAAPPTVSEGDLIRVSHYNGTGSIKEAANDVMRKLE